MTAMQPQQRDSSILRHMAAYCADAMDAAAAAGSETAFAENRLLQHAAAMCVLEIGELAKRLSEEYVQKHSEIPWRAVCRMRDLYAHHYHATDPHELWVTITQDLPALRVLCEADDPD